MIFNRYAKGGAGGFLPNIVVTAPTGSTVTCTKDDKTLNAVEDNGTWTFKVPEFGTWTVNAVQGSATKSATVDVEEVKIYSVTITYVSNTLDENSWATIKSVSDAGTGANYWSVGDCKEVVLNGKASEGLTLNNYSICVYIIGFNHNETLEGVGITFQGFKTIAPDYADVCMIDSEYGSIVSVSGCFSMNSSRTNSGGWASSQMRTNICGTNLTSYAGTIIAVIPEALRAVLKSVTKYTDNTGGGGGSMARNVTATTDYFFFLSAYEVFGSTSYGNTNESSKQAQYSYYSAGNSKVKYRHDATTTAARWWLRSPRASNSYSFVYVYADGTASTTDAFISLGFAPAFVV